MVASTTENEKEETVTLCKFIAVGNTDFECHASLISMRIANRQLHIASDMVLVLVSPLNGASQEILKDSLQARFLCLCLCYLSARLLGE